MKTVLICLFDCKDIVHVECLQRGQTRGFGSVLNCGKRLEIYRKCCYINTWIQSKSFIYRLMHNRVTLKEH